MISRGIISDFLNSIVMRNFIVIYWCWVILNETFVVLKDKNNMKERFIIDFKLNYYFDKGGSVGRAWNSKVSDSRFNSFTHWQSIKYLHKAIKKYWLFGISVKPFIKNKKINYLDFLGFFFCFTNN